MSPRKKLLVTGASGFLGWNLCSLMRSAWDITATYHSHPIQIKGVNCVRLNLTNWSEVKEAFRELRPDAVVHTAAASQPNYCQEHPEESRRINLDSAVAIAGLCADAALPSAFVSTDLVFDGTRSPYREEDPVSPVSVYAEQKVLAERGIRDRHPSAAVCRTPLMFGAPGPVSQSFIQPFLRTMRAGEELRLFEDEFRTPVSAVVAVRGIMLALDKARGLIHLGGRERVSRYVFGKLLAELLEIDTAVIVPCRQEEIQMAAPRPKDVSLDSSLAFSLGYDPPTLKEQIEEIRHLI